MAYDIRQSSTYEGNDWWSWEVWLEGTPAELARVEAVEYRLHETFPQPIVKVSDAKSKFLLSSGGWGTFTIRARVLGKGGRELKKLAHSLHFDYPDDGPDHGTKRARVKKGAKTAPTKSAPAKTSATKRAATKSAATTKAPVKASSSSVAKSSVKPTGWETTSVVVSPTSKIASTPKRGAAEGPYMFLSYSAADRDVAAAVKDRLRQDGVAFRSGDEVPAGEPLQSTLEEYIAGASASVAILPGEASRWVEAELQVARDLGKPVFAILGKGADLPPALADRQRIGLEDFLVDPTKASAAMKRLLGG